MTFISESRTRFTMQNWMRCCLVAVGMIAGAAQAQVPSNVYSYSRSSSFAYDATTGLLTSETVEPDNPNLCVTTTYQYDAYGNKTIATTANCAGASGRALFTSRASSSTFDTQPATVIVPVNGVPTSVDVTVPAGAFATSASNALNQSESRTYDPRFGNATSLTGPNTLTTNWQVDDFGRTVRESRADGTATITAYCYLPGKGLDTSSNSANCPTPAAGEAPSDAITFVHSEPHNTADVKNGPFSRVYVDREGRKLRTVTEAFDGPSQPGGTGRLIVQDTDYNAQGVAIVTTQPYFFDSGMSVNGGSTGYGMTRSDYDLLGRPTAIYVTDSQGSQGGITFGARSGSYQASVTSIVYTGLTTRTTNDKGQTRTEEKNVDGKVVRVTDNLGAQIAHQYDAFGNLIQTKDALKNTVTISYDIRGRKLSTADPDTGTWNYDYDALGELVWQQSPNQYAAGQVTTMAYDVLGRVTQRVEPEYTSNWYYDKYADGSSCNKGTGKLCETSTSNGIGKKIVYDSLGRIINARTTVTSGPSFASATSYDSANGWPTSQSWPTGLTVNYNYTAKGYLNSVTLATAATVNPLPATSGGTPGASTTLAAGSLLWQAQAYNAWGKAEQYTYGNNVISKTSYDAQTGRVMAATAGLGTATTVMKYTYSWDSINHLTSRIDANGDGSSGAVTDTFQYDGIGRLATYSVNAPSLPNLARTVGMQYNALGMVLYKSDVGTYSYNAQGSGVTLPHALQSVSGTFSASYTYDANGNMKTASAGSYRSISYTSFNLPDSQAGLQGPSGSPQYTWQYDENHQRIKEVRVNSSGTRTTWELHPDNAGGLAFESEQDGGATFNRHYISAGGQTIAVLVSTGALPTLASTDTAPPTIGSITLIKVEYWHKDHLGSLVSTTDHTGVVTARYSYDPFGKRRYTNGNYDANGNLVIDWTTDTNNGTDRGWTGHEHLDDVGVVHMNGRIFDPRLGVFMQGDPFVQDPLNLQNFNRYAYCYNNPMTCTDPSGYLFGGMFNIPVFDNLWNHHIKPYLPTIVAIAVSIYIGPGGYGWGEWGLLGDSVTSPLAQAAIAGFTSGTIATGNLKGGLQGMASALAFYGAGSFIHTNPDLDAGLGLGGIAVHGVVGCATSAMSGNKCGPGALSASFSHAMAPTTMSVSEGNPVLGTVISAIAGGTASVLGGGKFENGATTGSFSYLFNCIAHECFAQGRDAERTFRGYLDRTGRTERYGLSYNKGSDTGGNYFAGFPDIFSEDYKMVWDVKPDSLYGWFSGWEQIARYTAASGYNAGAAAPLFGDRTSIILEGQMNRYEYTYNEIGLVIYHALDMSPAEKSIMGFFIMHNANRNSDAVAAPPMILPPAPVVVP